jgi:hypothetical protein
MTKTLLSDNWHLAAAHEVSHTDIQNVDLDCANWMSVTVPSTVQSALVESGRAPSPWRDCNAKAFERYENDTWLYRTVFDVPADDAIRAAVRWSQSLRDSLAERIAGWLHG